MVDAETQRLNMVESQVRPSDVTDRRIIRAMMAVPRHVYVPDRYRTIAYVDGVVPLTIDSQGRPLRALLAPRVFAKLLQVASVPQDGTVLLVGTGLGYGPAVVAQFARSVVGIEPDQALAEASRGLLATQNVTNATIITCPIVDGSNQHAPFDAIVIEGAVPEVPNVLLDQLKDGGRLVTVRMAGPLGAAIVATRSGNRFDERPVFDATAPLLPGFSRKAAFAF